MQTLTNAPTKSIPNTANMPFLSIDNVSKVYPTPTGDYTVLDGVNLTVSEGEFVCVIGHSGCGKSTLLDMVDRKSTRLNSSHVLRSRMPSSA